MARSTNTSDQFLEHYGIPGMKWGKRSSKKATAPSKQVATPFPKNRPAKGVTDLSPKPIKQIPDVELRQRINRIQMETQYKDLTEGKSEAPKSKVKKSFENMEKGHKIVKNVMGVAKTAQTIHKFANSDLAKDIAKLLKDDDD